MAEIWFTHTKKGRKMAFKFSTRQLRSFRIPLAEAELMLATGAATLLKGNPMTGEA